LAAFAGCLALSGTLLPLPGQTPSAGIEGQLRSQYQIASVGSNGVVARAGTIVAVQQDGITALPAPQEWPCNTYKQGGRIKQSTLCAVNYSPTKPDTRLLQVGEKAYLTAIQVKPSEVVFKVQTCCGDVSSAPFRATVAFQFQKGYLDSMNAQQIRDTVNGIFAIDTSETGDGPPPPGPQPTQLSGLYFLQQTGAKLQLNPDGSFSLLAANGQVSPGHFTVSSDTLALTYSATGRSSVFRIQGDKFYASSGLAWVRVGDSPQPPPPPPPPPLKLPSTYAKAQTPSDQLQLNDDHTFSLQEAGQTYGGTFTANGATVELNIKDGPTSTATIQGDNLTDSSGQSWVLQKQPSQAAGSADVLQNQDILKMVQAGFDDATILAKIGSSKCHFDTSTDALIHLKQSGTSAGVLKAMVGK
jgi:hypothetical protein